MAWSTLESYDHMVENFDNKMEAAKGRIHKPREVEQNDFLYQ